MLKVFLIAATIAVLPVTAFAEVKADCSAKMNGDARCEFTNSGKSKQGSCVVIQVVRIYDAKMYTRPTFGGKGTALTSEKICSGLVDAGDIRERVAKNSWSANGTPMTPLAFCESDNPWEKAPTNCIMETKTVDM